MKLDDAIEAGYSVRITSHSNGICGPWLEIDAPDGTEVLIGQFKSRRACGLHWKRTLRIAREAIERHERLSGRAPAAVVRAPRLAWRIVRGIGVVALCVVWLATAMTVWPEGPAEVAVPTVVLILAILFGYFVWEDTRANRRRAGNRDRPDTGKGASDADTGEGTGESPGLTLEGDGSGMTFFNPSGMLSIANLQISTPGIAIQSMLGELTAIEPEPTLPVREGDLPFLAWKHARIVFTPLGYAFRAITSDTDYYDAEATAQCRTGPNHWTFSPFGESPATHQAPHENCRCGFYGLKDEPEPNDRTSVLLQVEFAGRVILAEHGYRAEHQRVLTVHAPAQCEFCNQAPAGFVIVDGYSSRGGFVVARCAQHHSATDVPVSREALTQALGVEVVFG